MNNIYVSKANAYAENVVSGALQVCKWTKLAAQRQLDNLKRQTSDDWPWIFDEQKAARICEFVQLLPHVKGSWARDKKNIVLEPWQLFVLTTVFGWVHRETGFRRFREAYIEVPRKNAKSTLSSAVGLYMLTADGEEGAECYSVATTRDQARIVFDAAKAMALRSSDLREHLGVEVFQHSLIVASTESKFVPLSSEGSTLDGLNVHFASIDELHAHKKRDVYDVIDTARGAREQSILWCITTAGSDISGICYERRTHVAKVLEGVIEDPSLFGIIYTIDDDDDPLDSKIWAKANPNWNVSVLPDDMENAARKAEAMPSAMNNFLTKRLNVWVSGESPWLDMRDWDRCGDAKLRDLSQFTGRKAWIGLDLAQKKDFAALCLVFQDDDKWCVVPRLYLNELAVQESGNAHLAGWARQNFVQVTDGDLTDFNVVAEDLRSLCRDFDVQEIDFDPALSMYFAGALKDEGLPMVEITQRSMFFTQPILQVENLVLEGKLAHDANPVMAWMISNMVIKESKFSGLRSPTKERTENKIDGPIAMLMALGRALSTQPSVDIDNYLNNMVIA